MNDPLTTPYKIAFAGDWHGNQRWAIDMIDAAGAEHADVIIHTGDFGYKFAKGYLNALNAALEEWDMNLLFVDGNHDKQRTIWRYTRPTRTDGLESPRMLRSRIWHLPRGYRWQWGEVKFLAMGGAYSVDRDFRLHGEWWPEEEITERNVNDALKLGETDVLISHDCPRTVKIPNLEKTSVFFPEHAIWRAEVHRDRLLRLVVGVRPRLIVHGHYHRSYGLSTELGYGPISVIGLDCDETSKEKNLKYVLLQDIETHVQELKRMSDAAKDPRHDDGDLSAADRNEQHTDQTEGDQAG